MFYRDPTSDLVWTVVPKNMSTTMSHLVVANGWEQYTRFELVPKHLYIFSIIQNPWTRFCKGMAENAWIANERSFEMVRKMPYYKMAFMNPHLMPISAQYPEAIPYMNYVPMDAPGYPAIDILNALFEQHGSQMRISAHDNQHVSSTKKLAYQADVAKWLTDQYPYKKQVQYFNQVDFDNWRISIKALDPEIEKRTWFQNLRNWIWTSE